MGTVYVSRTGVWRRWACAAALGAGLWFAASAPLWARQAPQTATPPRTPPAVGTIQAISGNTITLTTDAGAEIKILVSGDTRLQRVPPGSKDLKEAVPIQLSDLQAGDRVLVRGKPGDDAATLVATSVVAMKKEEIADQQAKEREEWQRRGTGGIVRSVDPAAGVITVGAMSAAGNKEIAIHASKTTIFRRYAPGSVRFENAKPSALDEIKVGDQVRVRGTRTPDGLDFSADDIVFGTFRNIAGTIVSIDAGAGTLTVSDLITKKNVEVKLVPDSQLRKLPQPMAQRIAMRLKGETPDANAPEGATKAAEAPAARPMTAPGQGTTVGGPKVGMGGSMRQGGGDLQQMLSRLPASTLGDFQRGDAILIVATNAPQDHKVVAITLLGGVEPILQASPQGQAASILTPWSLGNGGNVDMGTP